MGPFRWSATYLHAELCGRRKEEMSFGHYLCSRSLCRREAATLVSIKVIREEVESWPDSVTVTTDHGSFFLFTKKKVQEEDE
uniref:Uncharacterized protein n=1 Tax=Picea glauca TaxID=3330 RepID=A0A101LUB6_PICGL|nr:hypothetical protein ABT39_MTgene2592 [Picea glauca]QHR87081.1 hypothetical protein Q903MT_gene1090 [Picea sitchensis]